MLVRNVGHLMTNPAILDKDGNEVPEGMIDAMFTICIAMHDLNGDSGIKNSQASIYIVKPKCTVLMKFSLLVIYFQQLKSH